ncbi:MAG: hypothetical protein IBJ15_21330 [Alphaproteobacteria bacterium]|nr:hypothetical protein [Alphaproteobacteria bacterium]
MRAMILEADCLGYLPAVTLLPGRECAGVVPAGAGWLDWHRPVGLTLRKRTELSPACRRLVAELRKVCAERFPANKRGIAHKGGPMRGADRDGLI